MFCSGQVPLEPATGSLVEGTIGVAALPLGAHVEIDAVVALPD